MEILAAVISFQTSPYTQTDMLIIRDRMWKQLITNILYPSTRVSTWKEALTEHIHEHQSMHNKPVHGCHFFQLLEPVPVKFSMETPSQT